MQTRRIIYIRIWENVRLAINKLADDGPDTGSVGGPVVVQYLTK